MGSGEQQMNVHQLSSTHWQVDSASQEGVQYDVHQHGVEWDCSCPNRQYRKRLCKHIVACWDFIKQCPACHGKGIIEITSFVWYDETGERSDNRLPCSICEGSGRRPRPVSDLPSDAALREIFK